MTQARVLPMPYSPQGAPCVSIARGSRENGDGQGFLSKASRRAVSASTAFSVAS